MYCGDKPRMKPMFSTDMAVFTYAFSGWSVLKKVRMDCCAWYESSPVPRFTMWRWAISAANVTVSLLSHCQGWTGMRR